MDTVDFGSLGEETEDMEDILNDADETNLDPDFNGDTIETN